MTQEKENKMIKYHIVSRGFEIMNKSGSEIEAVCFLFDFLKTMVYTNTNGELLNWIYGVMNKLINVRSVLEAKEILIDYLVR